MELEVKSRNIGINNFEDYNFDRLIENAKILPAIHQTECHPYRQMKEMREDGGIWYPADVLVSAGRAEGRRHKCNSGRRTICRIAQAHGKPAAQGVLRFFEMQEDLSLSPAGVSNPYAATENFGSQDFELTESEMNDIRALNQNNGSLWHLKSLVLNRQKP